MASHLRRLVMLGPPGSGKGTYAKLLAPLVGVPHISTGDLLRQHIAEGTALGRVAQTHVASGGRVPDSFMAELLQDAIAGAGGFILDGFPRSLEQAHLLSTVTAVDRVVHIQMREDIIVRKLLGRRHCSECGSSWNVEDVNEDGIVMPAMLAAGGCCVEEGKLEKRADDTLDVIMKRQREYKADLAPLLDYYQAGGLVHDVDIKGGVDVMMDVFAAAAGLPVATPPAA